MKECRGFSLILFSIAIAIASLAAVALVNFYPSQRNIITDHETVDKINNISLALTRFVGQYGRLPCPASPSDNIQSASFGKESRDSAFICNATDIISPTTTIKHYSGAVPVQTLGLPKDYMLDGWGNKIEYVVSPNLYVAANENATNFSTENGSLIVQDDNNINLETQTAFILISRGKNGYGAYSADSTNRNTFPPLSKPSERENLECSTSSASCSSDDFNSIYKLSPSSSSDDILLYKNKSTLMLDCSLNTNSSFCKTNTCVNSGATTYWKNAARVIENLQESISITKKTPLPYLDLTSAIKEQSDSYQLKLNLQTLSTFHGDVTLRYEYSLSSDPTNLINERIAYFSTDNFSGDFSSTHVGNDIYITFGALNQIPNKLYFVVNTTANDATIDMKITDIQILYPNANLDEKINYQVWENIGSGTTVFDLLSNSNYPNAATSSSTRNSTEGLTNYADNYGTKMWGYITPTTSGTYQFYLEGGGSERLFLSTDYSEGNKQLLTNEPEAAIDNQRYQVGEVELNAGTSYYIEAITKHASGTDSFKLSWSGPGIPGVKEIVSDYLSTVPKSIISTPPTCNSFFKFTANLSAAASSQPADIISLNNAFGRYVKITLNSNQPTSNGMNSSQDMYFLREIRFRDNNNNIISPGSITIYKYSSNYAILDDYLSYSPTYLLDEGNITDSTTFTSVSDINIDMKGKGWLTQNVSKPQYLIFDLGTTYQLKDILIWNGNQLHTENGITCCPGRSVKNVSISVTNDLNHLLYYTD